MEKEPLKQSGRFKVFLTTIILEFLLLAAGWASAQFGWQIPQELLESIALTLAGLAITLIAARTVRNTPVK